jgi:outer membrane protein assembly factor BamB
MEDWPWWRGPNSDNTSAGGQVPTVWSETENVLWKVTIPGQGHGSPSVVGNQIFLATADEEGPAQVMANTMTFGGNFVYASGGYPEKELFCIRADGSGDIVWQTGRDVTYVPSPLFHQGRLYVVNDRGIATLFDAHNGDVIWRERLGGAFSASPTLVGDLLYVPNEAGTTFVLKASDHFEIVARNDLGDGGFATPVICGGRLYLRTSHHLYVIGDDPA